MKLEHQAWLYQRLRHSKWEITNYTAWILRGYRLAFWALQTLAQPSSWPVAVQRACTETAALLEAKSTREMS